MSLTGQLRVINGEGEFGTAYAFSATFGVGETRAEVEDRVLEQLTAALDYIESQIVNT